LAALVLILLAWSPSAVRGQGTDGQPVLKHPVASQATVDEHAGSPLPLEVPLRDEAGRTVTLGHYFRSGRPVLLVPGYYTCRMLCPLILNGLHRGLGGMPGSWSPESDYVVVGISIDPRDGPAQARARKAEVGLGRGWHLLTGDSTGIRRITDAMGFHYAYDARGHQYAHPALVMAAAPDGTISRYVYGLNPEPDSLSAVLAQARAGRSAFSIKKVLVRCFRFSPTMRRYAGALAWFLRAGALAIVLGLLGVFVVAARRVVREEGV